MLVRVTFHSGEITVAETLTTEKISRGIVRRALGRPVYAVEEWAGVKDLRPTFLPVDRRITKVTVEEWIQ